jgi:uncharacterized protein YggE
MRVEQTMLGGLSVSTRAAVAGVAAAALLIGAFALGASQASGPAAAPGTGGAPSGILAAATASAAGASRITVTGTGTVTGTPDQLVLSMGVQTNGSSVSGALAAANGAVRSVTGVLRHGGVAAADIQTSGLSIYPDYSGSGAPSGYAVSESLQVTLRHLATAGSLISQAARAGGNATVVDGVSLDLSGDAAPLAAARAKAVADARTKAAQYARALGRPLGPALSVSEAAQAPLPIYDGLAQSASGGAKSAAVPVHPGTQQLTVNITVVFAIG